MNKEALKKIKLIITVILILIFVWFLIISPMITFHNNESSLENTAKRYYELNSNELPSGENVKTITLKKLYHKSFIKNDLYIPYTNKTCSIENSWVKVKRVDGQYKYYTYLECGVLSSTVDHKGPVITLNGDESVSVGKGDKYKEAGVKSVVDNTDGKIDTSKVEIKGDIDTSKIGTYEITYAAFDSLNNKTVVTREVKVVQKLNSTLKKDLNNAKNFTGNPENNYVRLSNMLFRVYGLDANDNVIIVSDEDIANVNYTKIDKWLDYYYNNLNEFAKEIIVKSKYCNMTLTDTTLDITKCSGYTKERNVYIPSVIEINKAASGSDNFMRPNTMSWTANSKDKTKAYLTRSFFFGSESNNTYLAYDVEDNYGVRPMMVIKGSTLITSGDGTSEKPYIFGDTKKAKGGSLLNERFTGEYISIDDYIYRIIKTNNDGTTKVVSDFTINDTEESALDSNGKIIYDPTKKSSIGYYINNRTSEYINTKYFVKHEIEVPIYKNKIIYGEEIKTNKYSVVLSAPNMYEIFGAQPQSEASRSYWMINTSQQNHVGAAMLSMGVPINGKIEDNTRLGVRVIGFVKKGTTISSGEGTKEKPYVIR